MGPVLSVVKKKLKAYVENATVTLCIRWNSADARKRDAGYVVVGALLSVVAAVVYLLSLVLGLGTAWLALLLTGTPTPLKP